MQKIPTFQANFAIQKSARKTPLSISVSRLFSCYASSFELCLPWLTLSLSLSPTKLWNIQPDAMT